MDVLDNTSKVSDEAVRESLLSERELRLYQNLRHDMRSILHYLTDKNIHNISVSDGGLLWIDTKEGKFNVGKVTSAESLRIIQDVAGIAHTCVRSDMPTLMTDFPFYKEFSGQRFTAMVPPVTTTPTFQIRKHSPVLICLEKYIETGRLTEAQYETVIGLIKENANILISGQPNCGKTTFMNSLISESVKQFPNDRFVILENTRELQCEALNKFSILCPENVFSMQEGVKVSMRVSPDRILAGEIIDKAAFAVGKAWNTGCRGGICTLHANDCKAALQRFSDLCMEAGLQEAPLSLIAHTIHAVIHIGKEGENPGVIKEIVRVKGLVREGNRQVFKLEQIG